MMRVRRSKKKSYEYSLTLFSKEFTPPNPLPPRKALRLNDSRWKVIRTIEHHLDPRFETIVWFYFDVYLHYTDYSDYDLYCDISPYVPHLTYPF